MRFLPLFAVVLTAFGQVTTGASGPSGDASGPGLYAVFDTSMGTFTARLFEDKAPETVKNFVALAEGTKPSANAAGTMVKKRFFDGLTFHRVIKGFMIQTGDVRGTGDSNCGVATIPDEIAPDLKFDRAGRLGMANIGKPNTANCQMFITVAPAPHLDGSFTIFGQVVSGQDVVDRISEVPTGDKDMPVQQVILNKVTIERRK